MDKIKMLYASPFVPMKSGISDYSAILVSELARKADITLYIDNYKLKDQKFKEEFDVLRYGVDTIYFHEYKYLVYNIGNNPYYHSYIYETCLKYPGVVILHDVILYYLTVGYYQSKGKLYSKIYEMEGIEGVLKVKEALKSGINDLLRKKSLAHILPLNQELLHSQNKFIVHSEFAYQIVKKHTDNVKKINMIPQVHDNFRLIEKMDLFKKFHISEDVFVIASFGIIAETKRNDEICRAVLNIHKELNRKICYVMVGEGDYVNQFVDHRIIYKTGFVSMNEFDSFIVHSDIVLNLRYPSMGETSAALIKVLQMGKACIINDEGWFGEIPDDCVIKIGKENIQRELEAKLKEYIGDSNKRLDVAQKAKQYIEREYAPRDIIKSIFDFI